MVVQDPPIHTPPQFEMLFGHIEDDDDPEMLAAIAAYLKSCLNIKIIPISKMFVDPIYARPVSQVKVNAILEEGVDPILLGQIKLSLRPSGRYAVIDGNHRRDVCRALGITHMVANVIEGLTVKQEAKLFVKFNQVNIVKPLDKFRARLGYNEPQAEDIVRGVEEHGLHISYTKGTPSQGGLQAVGALDRLYDDLGPQAFRDVIGIIKAAWGTERRAWTVHMIGALRQFWMRYREEVDRSRLIEAMAMTTPERLMGAAGVFENHTAAPSTLVGRVLVERYNKGLRTRRLPPWIERPGTAIAWKDGAPEGHGEKSQAARKAADDQRREGESEQDG